MPAPINIKFIREYAQAQAWSSNKASDYSWVCGRWPLKLHEYENKEEDLGSQARKGWLLELKVQSYDLDRGTHSCGDRRGEPEHEPGASAVGQEHRVRRLLIPHHAWCGQPELGPGYEHPALWKEKTTPGEGGMLEQGRSYHWEAIRSIFSLRWSLWLLGKIRTSLTFCSASKIMKVKVPPEILPSSHQFLYMCAYKYMLPRWHSGKEFTCQCRKHRRCGFDLWVGKIPGVGNGNPLQYSCLENPTDRGAWQATVHGVTKSQTQLSMHKEMLCL